MDNFVVREMNKLNADGVDFVALSFDYKNPDSKEIYYSFTRNQMEQASCAPKTNRAYWRYGKNHEKVYIRN